MGSHFVYYYHAFIQIKSALVKKIWRSPKSRNEEGQYQIGSLQLVKERSHNCFQEALRLERQNRFYFVKYRRLTEFG